MRILIVDDDPLVGTVLLRGLRSTGWSVETETLGQRALDRHAADPYDVIVTDVFMPGMDGLELIGQLRRSSRPPRIIAMSSNPLGGTTDYLSLAKGLGADAAITKPFQASEIARLIQLCGPFSDRS